MTVEQDEGSNEKPPRLSAGAWNFESPYVGALFGTRIEQSETLFVLEYWMPAVPTVAGGTDLTKPQWRIAVVMAETADGAKRILLSSIVDASEIRVLKGDWVRTGHRTIKRVGRPRGE